MLLTVIGTQNTGKSTFINDFLSESSGWLKPSIDYRTLVKEKNLKLNREGNLYSQNILFNFLLKDLLENSQNIKNIILDRSIIDAYVYTYWLYKNNPESSSIKEEHVLKMFNLVNKYVGLYDNILYIPLNKCNDIIVIEDGIRDTDLNYRKQIDDIFYKTIQKLNIKNLIEIYGTRAERIEKIRNLRIKNSL